MIVNISSGEEIEFTVELLGILSNLNIEKYWVNLLTDNKLLDFLQRNLVVGFAEDDVVLECIMLVGTIVSS